MPELTEASMADYLIVGRASSGIPDRKVRAAYVTGDDSLPGCLVFKDHKHRVIALVSQDAVLSVERVDVPSPVTTFPAGCCCTYTWNMPGYPPGEMVRQVSPGCNADHREVDKAQGGLSPELGQR